MKTGSSNFISNLVAFLLGIASWRATLFVFSLLIRFAMGLGDAGSMLGLLLVLVGTCTGVLVGAYVVRLMLKGTSTQWAKIGFYLLVAVSGMQAAVSPGGMLESIMTFIPLGILVYHEFKMKKHFN